MRNDKGNGQPYMRKGVQTMFMVRLVEAEKSDAESVHWVKPFRVGL